jgi:hypothetical protein
MPRTNRKRILLWTTLLTGLGAGALWASTQTGWVQDRLFGPSIEQRRVEPRRVEQIDSRDRMIYDVVIQEFDHRTGELLELRCVRGVHFAEIQDYFRGFVDPPLPPPPLLEVDQDRARVFAPDIKRFLKPYALSPEESRDLWNVITAFRPRSPSRVANAALLLADPFRGGGVELAVCEDGWLWTALTHPPRTDSPIVKVLEQYSWGALRRSSLGS